MKLKPFLQLALLTLLVICTSTYVLAQTMSSDIPSTIKSCIPQRSARFIIQEARLITQVSAEDKTYYLLRLFPENSPEGESIYFTHVVLLQAQACQVAYSDPLGDNLPLSHDLPQAIANQLTLLLFKQTQQSIGETAFRQRVNQALASGTLQSMAPEEVWALQQLGFSVPERR